MTLCSFEHTVVGLPDLPVSLRHLVLDGRAGVGPHCEPPYDLRLGGLTRLESLSLLGCAANALEDEYTRLGPFAAGPPEAAVAPLPPSLRTLRLEDPTGDVAVRLSRTRLSAASGLAIEASIAFIACDIGIYADDALAENPWYSLLDLSADLPADVRESQSTSLLPAGVRTLSIETDFVTIACAHMPPTLKPQAVCAADAVQKLCELFGTAPDSYHEFHLSSRSERTVSIMLEWDTEVNGLQHNIKRF